MRCGSQQAIGMLTQTQTTSLGGIAAVIDVGKHIFGWVNIQKHLFVRGHMTNAQVQVPVSLRGVKGFGKKAIVWGKKALGLYKKEGGEIYFKNNTLDADGPLFTI